MLKNNILILIITIIIVAIIIIASFKPNPCKGCVFNLTKSYYSYKQDYMSKDGRIMDPQRGYITTSEGQSYILLMCLIMKDKETFDLVYNWTKNNLCRSDGLFSWLWGKSKGGQYKVLDYNSATDADINIAFALIAASKTWEDEYYQKEAVPIIQAIWDNETRRVGDHLVLMPGVEQTLSEKIEVNPSYFAPNAFRLFQQYDNLHDWNELIDSSYYYLQASMAKTKTGLPPNWFLIQNDQNGEQIILENSERSDFSYDAIRVFWTIYRDYTLHGEKRALPILEKSKFFIEEWKKNKTIYVNYQANGKLRDKVKFVGSIALLLPTIKLYDKQVAKEIYNSELLPYLKDPKDWNSKNEYYGRNLLWFGYYLYNDEKIK